MERHFVVYTQNITLYKANISMNAILKGDHGDFSAMIGSAYRGEIGDIIVHGGNIDIKTFGAGIGAGSHAITRDITQTSHTYNRRRSLKTVYLRR